MVSVRRPIGWSLLVALMNGRTWISDERLAPAGATLLVARTAHQLDLVAGDIRRAGKRDRP